MQTATFELLLIPQDAVRDLLACPALLFYLRKEVVIVVLVARHNEGLILELADVLGPALVQVDARARVTVARDALCVEVVLQKEGKKGREADNQELLHAWK